LKSYQLAFFKLPPENIDKINKLISQCHLIHLDAVIYDESHELELALQDNTFSLVITNLANIEQEILRVSLKKIPVLSILDIVSIDSIQEVMSSGVDDCFYLNNLSVSEFERIIIRAVEQKTAKLAAEKLSEQLSKYDELIGIPNKTYCLEILERNFDIAQRWQGVELTHTPLVFAFIEIERVKHLKESLDLALVDLMYILLSSKIKEHFFHFDVVARWSENRFAVILENTANSLELQTVINKLQSLASVINAPLNLININITMNSNIGVCIFDSKFSSVQELIKGAEVALVQAQREGLNNCKFNTNELNALSIERNTIIASLQSAIKKEELQLYYQPVVSSFSGELKGAEALLRWQLPNGDWVSPEKIVTLAEELEIVDELGYQILVKAIVEGSQFVKQIPHFKMAVNLSVAQLKDTNFSHRVRDILDKYQFNAMNLVLEITETQLMSDVDTCIENLNSLQAIGVNISIDDFGTGHSSLEYLSLLPANSIKIDRSFVNKISLGKHHKVIIRAIIGLAHSLDACVVAEGVEDKEQLTYLRSLLAADDEIQGYFYSRPLPLAEFMQYVASHFPLINKKLALNN